MEININSHLSSYHPVGVQAGLKTEAEKQDRGPDSIPPSSSSTSSQETNSDFDNTSTTRSRLDVRA